MNEKRFVIEKGLARKALLAMVLILGFINLMWLSIALAWIYGIVSIGLLIAENTSKRFKVASRFWVLVTPFIAILNGPQKLGWFLAFLATSWLASKNAFNTNEDTTGKRKES